MLRTILRFQLIGLILILLTYVGQVFVQWDAMPGAALSDAASRVWKQRATWDDIWPFQLYWQLMFVFFGWFAYRQQSRAVQRRQFELR